MIPSTNTILTADLTITVQPSKNYKMFFNKQTIVGTVDEQNAMLQVIYKILNTERYQYIIYSWNYGIELLDLYGQEVDYVCSELERRITEALIVDDRISACTNFEFDISTKKQVVVTFTVMTIFGEVEVEKAVNY